MAVQDVRFRLAEDLNLHGVNVIDSTAWWEKRFAACGDWDSWCWETVTGREYTSRKPYFNGFVVCTYQLGRANAQIVELALRNDKAVLAWSKGQPLLVVTSVHQRDSEAWVDGWSYKTRPLEG